MKQILILPTLVCALATALAYGCPWQCGSLQPMSSAKMRTTFGFSGCARLSKDPAEANDLAAQFPDRVKTMQATCEAWVTDLPKPLWSNARAE